VGQGRLKEKWTGGTKDAKRVFLKVYQHGCKVQATVVMGLRVEIPATAVVVIADILYTSEYNVRVF
jgi:hypothetical protein